MADIKMLPNILNNSFIKFPFVSDLQLRVFYAVIADVREELFRVVLGVDMATR